MRLLHKTFFLALVLALGCGGDKDAGNTETAPQGPIVLGAVYNLSGSQAGLDIPSSRGARLAVEQANQRGGIMGRRVELMIENGRSDLDVVTEKTEALFEKRPSLCALLGLSDTDMVLAAAPVAARAKRVFVTSGATSPLLPDQVPGYLFLACFGDNVQAAAGAEWAFDELPARTVSVLFNSTDSYTRLLHGYFETRFVQLGGQVLAVAGYTSLADLPQAIESLRKADMIYLASPPEEAPAGVEMLRKAGFDVPVLGGDGFDSEGLWEKHPGLGNVFFTTHVYLGEGNPRPEVQAFREAYIDAYPQTRPDAFAALGYDAASLLLAATARAGTDDPEAVYRALTGIHDFAGVTGRIGFSEKSRIPVKSVSVMEISGGAFSLRRELRPREVPPS